MPTSDPERRTGLTCAFALLLVWAGFLLTGRLGTYQALTWGDMAALRYGGSLVVALPIIAMTRFPRVGPWRGAALVATAGFGFPLLAYAGFSFAPASHAGVMMPGMLPFWTAALAAIVLGDAWTRQRMASLAVVALGIALLAADTWRDHPGAWRGDILFLGAGACWAVFTVLIRRWRVPALDATLVVAVWPAVFFLPVWWLTLPSNIAAVPGGVLAFQFAWQGGVAVVLAGFLFARAVAALGPGATTTITSAVPALAALGAWPLLGEPLGTVGLLGVLIVSAGMVLGVAAVGAAGPVSAARGTH